MKIFLISKKLLKGQHRSTKMHKFQVTDYDQREKRPYTTRGRKSALLNRAGNQLRTVPHPV